MDPRILPYRDLRPTIGADVFIADNARVIGDVHLGDLCSVWFGTVVRGDVFHIRIGRRVNLQDNSVVHVTTGRHATTIEDDVTVGHRAVIHGATVRRGALIGMGAIIMDGAEVGAEAMIGAGALVTPGTAIPPGTLAIGAPAKVVRALTADELAKMALSAPHYAEIAATYRDYRNGGYGKVELPA
jgi:carbonic anhydrase/acetyltransferase-like protein (isoleucine patch superfamily)